MKLTTVLKLTALVAIAAVAVVCLGTSNQALAQENTQNTQSENPTTVYAYVAQSDDSYSLMARKAVQTYGAKFKVSLSPAQIIYAETNLTLQADSPDLTVGQKVDINESTVKEWVERAQKLSDSTEAAWDYYAQFADFNTDSVGESS